MRPIFALLIACSLAACGDGSGQVPIDSVTYAGGSSLDNASLTGCGGHGMAQCGSGRGCEGDLLQVCNSGMCYFCCDDIDGTCGDGCQADDPNAGYYDPDCAPTVPACGGHGQPQCGGRTCSRPDLQACNDGMCYFCCADADGTCGDRCQGDHPNASYYDPDCASCGGVAEICAPGQQCGGAYNSCGEWISCGQCVAGEQCADGVCTVACESPQTESFCNSFGSDPCGDPTDACGVVHHCGSHVRSRVIWSHIVGYDSTDSYKICGDDFQWHYCDDDGAGCTSADGHGYQCVHEEVECIQAGDPLFDTVTYCAYLNSWQPQSVLGSAFTCEAH